MMKKIMGRPGAVLMAISLVVAIGAAIAPLYLALMMPSHEWFMILTGPRAFALSAAGVLVVAMYLIGFMSYCRSKGYGIGIGLCLFMCNLPGFVVLMLLPDRCELGNSIPTVQKHLESSRS